MPATAQDQLAAADLGSHATATATKKGKTKKAAAAVDSNASKLLQNRIAQLEQDAAGEKDQELEIGKSRVLRRLASGDMTDPVCLSLQSAR